MCIVNPLRTQGLFVALRNATRHTVRRFFKSSVPEPRPLFILEAPLRSIPKGNRGCTVSCKRQGRAKLSACHAQPMAGSKNCVRGFEIFVANRSRRRRRGIEETSLAPPYRHSATYAWPSLPWHQNNRRLLIAIPVRSKPTPTSVLTSSAAALESRGLISQS